MTTVLRPGLAVTVLLGGLVCGCGDEPPSAIDHGVENRPVVREASDALRCDGEVDRTGAGDYGDGGLERVADDPVAAVEDLVAQGSVLPVPPARLQLEAQRGDRALVTYRVGDERKVAFVVEDGVEDWDGGEGWGVTSWASCDLSELPGVAEQAGAGVWTDAAGTPVPTSRVESFAGPEHCDWQEVTFLHVGSGAAQEQYLRDPDGVLAELERGRYAELDAVPPGARDTGWQRDGRRLWLARDASAAYVVALDDPTDVERWPGTRRPVGCA